MVKTPVNPEVRAGRNVASNLQSGTRANPVNHSVTDESFKPQIDKIMAWDLSQVRKYILRNEKIDQNDLDRRIEEYRKYLCLSLVSGKRLPISEKVDIVWHTHILFTEDYTKMGTEIFGRYVHHSPTVSDEERRMLAPGYDNTLATYRAMFGEPDETYWPQGGLICWDPCE